MKRRFRTEATLKIARLDISVTTLSRRLPSLVLAVAGLFVALAVVARVLVAPQWDWNAARLAFSFALAEGYDLYPVDGSDPLPGYMYGPVFAIAYLPAKLFSSPTVAVLAGASLAVGYVLVPAFVLMRRCEPARLYSWIGLVALAGTCLVSDPLRYSTFSIHADAPLLGLLTAASAMWYSGAASPQLRVSAALMVAAALWCKQNVAPVAIAFPLWSLLVSGPGAGLRALFVLGAVVLAASIVTISAFGLKGLMFNLVTIPSSAPWYGSGTALERLAPVGIDYLRLVGPWWLLLAALAIIHRTLAGVPRETWRQWAARSPWLLIALEGALLAPMCILAKVRVGGGVNSWTPALFLLVIACLMAMLALTRRSESSRLPGGVVSVARALALAWALGIGNYQLLEPGPAEFQRPEVRHPFTNPQQQAHDYLSANPGSAYFPWNPLAHLMAESRLVHYADGIITRAAAGFPISQAEFEAGVGRNFAFVASAPTRRNQWVQQHYLSVFSERVDLPGLPGWTVYQVPSPKHP